MPVFPAVFAEHTLAGHSPLLILITNAFQVSIFALGEAVGINEMVVAGIVGRVNINHPDFAEVRLLQDFQNFQIFTFNK